MKELFECLRNILAAGKNAVLVGVLGSEGSVPGRPGALMAVDGRGICRGTVGGGAAEHEAEKLAARALAQQCSFTQTFTLRQNDALQLGMVCGGSALMGFVPLCSEAGGAAFCQAAIALCEKEVLAWLVWASEAGTLRLALCAEDGTPAALYEDAPLGESAADAWPARELAETLTDAPAAVTLGARTFYTQPLVRAGRVLVFGGGHLAQELVPLLARLGFKCVVFEDRPQFAQRALFPGAHDVVLGDFSNIAASLAVGPHDYVVAVTRGHAADFEVERQVLRCKTAYVGVIGSRAKTASVNARLLEDGIPQEALDAVHTPIGLPIGAKTPAEIAVSIAAELVAVRAKSAAL